MVFTRKGKRYANEQLESETPSKTVEKRLKVSKLSDIDMNRVNSDHKKSVQEEVFHKLCLLAVPSHVNVPKVSLCVLIEFAVQNTLREINILSELLPKKKDDNNSGRVRNLVQFADSLYVLFTKLLSVVKWIQKSEEFEKLSSINYFLEQQNASIVDAADNLVAIDIRELHFARLPAFSVDALASRYLEEDLRVRRKQEESFERLHHIIELQSSLSAQPIASKFDSIAVKCGMVTLRVSQEFEISLTIAKKEKSNEKTLWILLNIKILVNDNELGEGQGLLHMLQSQFLHRLVKERLEIADKPLMDAFFVLHSFCLRLQLDIIHAQIVQMGKVCYAYVQAENYSIADCRLVIGYWSKSNEQKKLTTSKHQIIIFEDKEDYNSGLKTYHQPFDSSLPVLQDEDRFLPAKLIASTILFRCQEKLLRIEKVFKKLVPQVVVSEVGHLLKSLSCRLYPAEECHPDKLLNISVHYYSGDILCEIPALGNGKKEVTELKYILESEELSPEALSTAINRIKSFLVC